jgi:hypothetical protein
METPIPFNHKKNCFGSRKRRQLLSFLMISPKFGSDNREDADEASNLKLTTDALEGRASSNL